MSTTGCHCGVINNTTGQLITLNIQDQLPGCLYTQEEQGRATQGAGAEADADVPSQIYCIKIGLESFTNTDPGDPNALPNFGIMVNDMVSRISTIRFEAMKLAYLHVIHMFDLFGTLPQLNHNFFRDCFFAVTYIFNTHQPGPINNPDIRDTFDIYRGIQPRNLQWTCRSQIHNLIESAITEEITTSTNNIWIYLKQRMIGYAYSRIHAGVVPLFDLPTTFRIILSSARAMIDTFWQNLVIEDDEGDIDTAVEVAPVIQDIATLMGLLPNGFTAYFNNANDNQPRNALWAIYTDIQKMINPHPLPLTNDTVKENIQDFWMMHVTMLKYLENTTLLQPVTERRDCPTNKRYSEQINRLIHKWHTEHMIPRKTRNVLEKEMRNAIQFDPNARNNFLHRRLSTQSLQHIANIINQTLGEITNGTFNETVFIQPRHVNRSYSILPQHSFTPLNIALDIAVMFDGLNSYQQLSPDLQNINSLQAFLSRPDCDLWWGRWFNFHLLHGLQGNRRFDGHAVVLGGDPGIGSLLVPFQVFQFSTQKHGRVPAAAIIVLHEHWGINNQIKQHAQRLVNSTGITTFVPDLYKDEQIMTAKEASHFMDNLNWRTTIDELTEMTKQLREARYRNVGSIGFGVGGYGIPPGDIVFDTRNITQRTLVQGHFGGRDNIVGLSDTNAVEALEFDFMLKKNTDVEIFRYPDQGYAFLNDEGDIADFKSTEAKVRRIARDRINNFFFNNLGGTTGAQ
ncbi:hypothetical protein BDA99DRAFT_562017 [Phascolomyces articulosus]|uniref:Dienelactone hydrolase domain-containing protein n=1 Tax=Phascolomyces articulosus TaxID=60185 RepID=A0AAD5K5S9_9FUNG|nr:hypothetical protein BDA99DRAFT_562017 [Phascolomyces articulosus]